MPRPRKCRRIEYFPVNVAFFPKLSCDEKVVVTLEELEAIRLFDIAECDQDTAAEKMNVSRGTYQRIIKSARSKITEALVYGKQIHIDGGDYEYIQQPLCCKKLQNRCGCGKKQKCASEDCIHQQEG